MIDPSGDAKRVFASTLLCLKSKTIVQNAKNYKRNLIIILKLLF